MISPRPQPRQGPPPRDERVKLARVLPFLCDELEAAWIELGCDLELLRGPKRRPRRKGGLRGR